MSEDNLNAGPSADRDRERSRSTEFGSVDAVCLITRKLDSALEKQKDDIFAEIEARFGPQVSGSASKVNTPKFRYEGNEKQFEFNTARLDECNKALVYLRREACTNATRMIEQTVKSLNERNKILRIADKYGWDVADEYDDDPITENNDDATKLRQAEYRAKAKRRQKMYQRYEPYEYSNRGPVDKHSANLFRGPG